ncbi:MAG TPA: hypothetical protein VLT83_17345 [Opitutaceae bacterium]|nr:hypothetical protein [Opitutaceae bacterium]
MISLCRWSTIATLALFAAVRAPGADPLTKRLEIDFGRDVASRDLAGFATRSDGRIVPGPVLSELAGPAVGELLWALEPADGPEPGRRWLVATGPEGRIVEITLDGATYARREIAHLAEPQIFALRALPDGSVLAGTSPTGVLYLLKNGTPAARIVLPVDSVFDIALLPGRGAAAAAQKTEPPAPGQIALIATGNPGRIYRVDLAQFARAGIGADKGADAKALAEKGITLFGEIRDRNVRRLALLPDGRIAAGSAPKGNVYLFPAAGGAPVILQENREAEVTDLLPQPNGDLFASIVFSTAAREGRIIRAKSTPTPSAPPAAPPPPVPPAPAAGPETPPAPEPPPAPAVETAPKPERFPGRSAVVYFPAGGFPEPLLTRSNLAFYRLARRGDLLLIAAGEEGEFLAWDLKNRQSLTFAGSVAAQLNGLAAVPGSSDRFLLLKNNAPGLALLDFGAAGLRRLETGRLDLGLPAELGDLRFASLRNIALDALQVDVKTSLGSDELEGWTDWTRLAPRDGALYAAGLRGRYVKVKIAAPAEAQGFELDTATLFNLPQNRRPVLNEFTVLPPNFAINPMPEPRPPLVTTLGQMLNPNLPTPGAEGAADSRRRGGFLASQLVPSPGSRVVYWTVTDADGDTLAYTLSIRRADAATWTDLAVDLRDNYVQFDTASLPDGVYYTRLTAAEQAPRPASQRLQAEFETDDFVIDHTPPEILDATVRRNGADLLVSVSGRDALSLLAGAEFVFNNGDRESVEHPVDGINDGREESYQAEVAGAKAAGATAVEIHLYDQSGNESVRRLALP